MATPKPTTIPRVPTETAMWEGTAAFDPSVLGKLSRTWIIFWERIFSGAVSTTTQTLEEKLRLLVQGQRAAEQKGPFQRTILLKDTTVGNDIADHVTVYGTLNGENVNVYLVTGVLRKSITADLTLRVNINGTALGTFTIPLATTPDTVISFKSFTTETLPDKGVLTWDVLASDGQMDVAGVASFTVLWQPSIQFEADGVASALWYGTKY